MRDFISCAALLVKVMASKRLTCSGWLLSSNRKRKERTSVWVFPDPAEALYITKGGVAMLDKAIDLYQN